MHPGGLRDHRGTRDKLDSRFLRWHTYQARPAHYHSGSWSAALHGRWDNRDRAHRESCSNFDLFPCDRRCGRDSRADRADRKRIRRRRWAGTAIHMTAEDRARE